MNPATDAMNSGTSTQTGGLGAAAVGFGLSPDDSIIDLSTVGGPFLVGEIVDDAGGLIGVLGVVDDGDDADGLLAGLVPAAAGELGGASRTGSPVGSGAEIVAKFSLPTTSRVFRGGGGPRVVFVTVTDRRDQVGSAEARGTTAQPDRTTGASIGGGGLEKLINVSLEVSVELGRTRVTLADVLEYDVGSTIELDRAAGSPVDIRVNDALLARGEVVLIDDEYAVRVTEILDPNQHH